MALLEEDGLGLKNLHASGFLSLVFQASGMRNMALMFMILDYLRFPVLPPFGQGKTFDLSCSSIVLAPDAGVYSSNIKFHHLADIHILCSHLHAKKEQDKEIPNHGGKHLEKSGQITGVAGLHPLFQFFLSLQRCSPGGHPGRPGAPGAPGSFRRAFSGSAGAGGAGGDGAAGSGGGPGCG